MNYAYGLELLTENNGTPYNYTYDGQGNVRQLLNQNTHAVENTYDYDAYGNLLYQSVTVSNGGLGYSVAPTVDLTGGNGQFKAAAVMDALREAGAGKILLFTKGWAG